MRTIADAWAKIREQLKIQGWPGDVYERGGGLQLDLSDDGRSVSVWLCDAASAYDLDAPMREQDFDATAESWIFLLGGAMFNRLPDALVRAQGAEFSTFMKGRNRDR